MGVLRITNRDKSQFAINDQVFNFSEFNDYAYHPYIAAGKWDAVYIDITEETPRGIIGQVVKRYLVKPVFDRPIEELTMRQVLLLTEIYCQYATELRVAYKRDSSRFKGLLQQVLDENGIQLN